MMSASPKSSASWPARSDVRKPDPIAVIAFFADARRRRRIAAGCDEQTAFAEAVAEVRAGAAELAANPIKSNPTKEKLPC